MMNFIPNRFATHTLLIILSLVMIFHALVLTGIIPCEIVWGGRLKNQEQMTSFEIVSILLNGVMLSVVAIYAGYVNVKINPIFIKAALWLMFALFVLNTIGNLFSNNELEKIIFTPVTILLSLFSLRLATDKG